MGKPESKKIKDNIAFIGKSFKETFDYIVKISQEISLEENNVQSMLFVLENSNNIEVYSPERIGGNDPSEALRNLAKLYVKKCKQDNKHLPIAVYAVFPTAHAMLNPEDTESIDKFNKGELNSIELMTISGLSVAGNVDATAKTMTYDDTNTLYLNNFTSDEDKLNSLKEYVSQEFQDNFFSTFIAERVK